MSIDRDIDRRGAQQGARDGYQSETDARRGSGDLVKNGRGSAGNGEADANARNNGRKKKYPLWKNVLAIIIVWVVVIAAAYLGSDIYTRHGQEVAVPDLQGLTADQAIRRLEALGLEGEVRDSIYNRQLSPDIICGQAIHAGNYVKVGRVVGLTINSDRAPSLVLPDIGDNMSVREAEARLKSMGFTLTPPEYIDGERDWVYSVKYKGCNVSAGTRIDISAPVTLVVGNGHTMMDEIEFDDGMGDSGAYSHDVMEGF